MSIWTDWASRVFYSRGGAGKSPRKASLGRSPTHRAALRSAGLESLERRNLLTVTANIAANILNIAVDNNESVVVSQSGGNVLINGVDPLSGVHLAAPLLKIAVTTTGDYANTIDLTAITQGAFSSLLVVQLDGGDGSDVYLLDQSGFLPLANVTTADTGATGSDSLTLSTTAAGPETISLNTSMVLRSTGATVTYAGFETLQVDGSAASDTISIFGTNLTTATTVNSGGGVDAFAAIDLTTIAAGLTINASGDGESLTLNTTTAGTVNVSSTTVQRTGNGAVNYSGFAALDVVGTAGVDAFNVASTAAATATTINAGGGTDNLAAIGLTTIGSAGLSINAGGDGETLTLNTTTAGIVSVSSLAVQRSGNGAVGYSGIMALEVNGTAGSDTFNVASTAALVLTQINALGDTDAFGAIDLSALGGALEINGAGNGEALVLNITTSGSTTTLSGTTVQRLGSGPLTYSGFAALNLNGTAGTDTVTISSTAAATATTVDVGAGADLFGAPINLTTIGSAGLSIIANGGESLSLDVGVAGTTAVSSISVQRSGSGGVSYSGISTLLITGTAGVDTFNIASTAAGSATTINALGGTDVFGAIDLTTIGTAGLTINAGSDGEALVANITASGPSTTLSSTTVQRLGNGALAYNGFATLALNGTTGGDFLSITSTAAGTATTVNTSTGGDMFIGPVDLSTIGLAGLNIITDGGEMLSVNTGVAGTVTITSTSLQRSGNGELAYSGLLLLDIHGTTGVDTFNVLSTASAIGINSGEGLDIFGAIDLSDISPFGISINAGGDGESLAINAIPFLVPVSVSASNVQQLSRTVAYNNFATLIVNGTAGSDSINVTATNDATATTINAGGGLDTFGTIALNSIGAAGLTINAGGDGESLTLNTATAGVVTVSSTAVQRAGDGAVNYNGLTSLQINGTAAADTFNVTSTVAGTATTISAAGGVDIFAAIDLTTIGAAGLTINAGGDGESLALNTTTAGTINLASSTVQRSGNGSISYSGLANLIVNGTIGIDTFSIASTAMSTATTVNGNSGLDLFVAIDLTNIGAAGLSINAGGDGESLTVNTAVAGTVAINSATVQRTGNGPVNYNGLAVLIVNGTVGADTFNIHSTAAGTATTINADSGIDAFAAIALDTISLAGLTINAGANGETLTLNAGTAGTVTISSSAVHRTGNGPVNYSGLSTLLVHGTATADTINVNSTAAGTATTVNSLGGIDIFGAIDLTTVGAAGLEIEAGGDGETLTVNAGTAGTVSVSSTSVQRTSNGSVNYGGLAMLLINGTADADTFSIISTAAGTATTILAGDGTDIFSPFIGLPTIGAAGLTLDAGDDGEALHSNVGVLGTTIVSNTAIQVVGYGALNYIGFALLQINGTNGADIFNVVSTSNATATDIITWDGTDIFGSIDLTTIGTAGLAIDAFNNSEVLTFNASLAGTVNVSNASVQRSGNGTVNYSGFATLIVNGTAAADTFNIASTALGTNTSVNTLGGADAFGAIELTTIGAAGLTINTGGDGESLTLNVAATGATAISAATVQRTGNGQVAYSGLAILDVNGTAGGDNFNVVSTHAATATTINALGGLDFFADIDLTAIGVAGLAIDAGGEGESLALNTTAVGTVAVSSTTVQRSGNGPVDYFGLATLIVNGTAGVDIFNVASTAAATTTTINALGEIDVFGAINLTTIGAAGLSINAGGNGEALTLNTSTAGAVAISATTVQRSGSGPLSYTGLASLDVHGTGGADTFNVASTNAATATTIDAGNGLDLFGAIDLTTIGAAGLTIDAGNDGELHTLNTTVTGTVDVSSTTVQRSGNGAVGYVGLAVLIVNGTGGADTFDIASTATGTATTINGGSGTDLFDNISLTTIGAAGLTVNAGANGESLALHSTSAGTVTITNSLVQRTGNGPLNYSGLANLHVNGTGSVDTFNVNSTFAATAYTLNSGASNDVITLGNSGTLSDILGALTIHGGAHDASPTSTLTAGPTGNVLPVGDTLHFNDVALGVGAVYNFTSTTFQRTGAAIVTFDTIETFVLDAGAKADTIDVQSTPASVNLTANGNGSADTINLLANGGNSSVLLYGGPSGDTINLQTIAIGSVVKAKGGTGDDTVNVSSDAAANLGTLDGIAGALLVDTDSGNDRLILSDHGQKGLHNSSVEVRNNRVRGFAGATNNSDVHYVFDGKLELTLVGSNSRSDKFMVQLPSKSGLTMRFDGGGGTKDCVHIEGTSGNDTVRVGSFTSTRPFRLQKIECLQMFGLAGNDTLDNHAPVSSLIDGGDGDDTLLGWSKVDVIFGGDGVDIIKGNGGNDYLFGDHEFNNRKPRVKNAVDNDNMMGGAGIDTIVAIKTDIVSAGGNVGDTIIGKSKGLTSVDWLKARFLTSSSKNIQNAIDEALAQSCTK